MTHFGIHLFGKGPAAAGILALVTGASLALPQAALAQAAPAVAPPTRTDLLPPEVRPEARRGASLTIDGGVERGPCALDDPSLATIRVTLSQVSFVGAEAATGVDLASAWQPYAGRDLPISVLCDIRARATQMLADAGYLAAVEIPEQRLEGGAAQFRVVLGRLTALRVRGDAGPSQGVLERYLQHLVGQPVFNVAEAERYLLLADDIPGLDVRLSLRPAAGGQPGDLIGEVAVLRRSVSASLTVQNYGAHALGRFGGLLNAQLFDLTGAGDVTTLSAYSSHDFDEQQTLQLGHDFLVGGEGLRLGGQVTFGWTNPTLGIAGFDVTSETFYAQLRASHPIVRRQALSVHGSGGIDLVNQDVEANGVRLSRDHVRTAWARLDLDTIDGTSSARRLGYSPYEPRQRLTLSTELRQGLGILGANDDCRTAPLACVASGKVPSRIEQNPTAFSVRVDASGEFRPSPVFAMVSRISWQRSTSALPAFEEMTAGNYSIGRGYDPGAITGDSGLALALEFRLGSLIPRSQDDLAVQPYAFVEGARVTDNDPSQRPLNPDRLASAGGGLRFAWGRGMQGDVSLAVPLTTIDSRRFTPEPRGDVRFLFSLTSRLAPWGFGRGSF